MSIIDAFKTRRSIYHLGRSDSINRQDVVQCVETLAAAIPDAFNVKTARAIVAFDAQHDRLWDGIFDAFGGKVAREKIDSFKAGIGTILYFYDEDTVRTMQEKFPPYAANFPLWAQQANGMFQLAVWTALAERQIGASLQHYNPVIDDVVRKLFNTSASWKLLAQMPFGTIEAYPEPHAAEDVSDRIKIFR